MKEHIFWKRCLIILCLTFLLAACDQVQASQKFTLKGTATKTPLQFQSTFTATKDPPPTHTASKTPSITPSPTNSPEATPTLPSTETATPALATLSASPLPANPTPTSKPGQSPQKATVKVSLTTNCRTGPGLDYKKLSPLQAGQTATLIGRDSGFSYWIIKDPGKTGRDCWLWGYYATTSGDVSKLPVYYPPALPTSKASSTPLPTIPTNTPKPTKTPRPSVTPKTPLPSSTPNLTPATSTNTPLPPTSTPIPSDTPIPSNTPLPSNTPPPTNTPPSRFCPYTSSLPGEEQQIMNMINDARRANGLNELTIKNRLVTAAREHGQDMTCNSLYGHVSSDGTQAWERIGLAIAGDRNWCYSHCCCGEVWSGHGSPSAAFDWWMTHKPVYKDGLNIHAWTILGKYYTRMGVGVTYYYNPNTGVSRKVIVVDFSSK